MGRHSETFLAFYLTNISKCCIIIKEGIKMAHHFSVGDFVEFKDEDNTPGFAVGVVTYVHNFGEFITVRNLI